MFSFSVYKPIRQWYKEHTHHRSSDIPPINANAIGRWSSDPIPELQSSGFVETSDR